VLYHDGEHIIAEASDANPDPNTNLGNDGNNITRWYTHSDTTDDLLAITPQANPTGLYYSAIPSQVAHYSVHTDHQGSVRAVTDLTGGVVNSYAYDAYGNAEAAVESLPQRFRYTGREWDGVTRLYHYRARAYDPETGRFLQEDPLWFNAGDLNVYRYVGMLAVIEDSNQKLASVTVIIGGNSVRFSVAELAATRQGTATLVRLYRAGKAGAIAGTTGAIVCNLFVLADIISVPDDSELGARTFCGYDYVPKQPMPPETKPQPEPGPTPKPKPRKPYSPPPAPDPRPQPPVPPLLPLPRGVPDSNNNDCNLPPLYRAVSVRDASDRPLVNGIYAKELLEETPIVLHIVSPDFEEGSWISTTKSLNVAKFTYAVGPNYGGYIVKINQCKVRSKIVDVSGGGTGNADADLLAIRDQEVLVRFVIPAESITIVGD
jgi:RHS repeat-associated protein